MPILAVCLFVLTLLLAACSSVLPPIQSMSDARQAVKAAQEARVQEYMPASMAYIERRMQKAEEELANGHHAYQFAHFNALVVKEEAVRAQKVAVRLNTAAQALEAVEKLGYTWSATEKLLEKAKQEARLGNLGRATRFAQQAEQQALAARQQAYLEQAKYELKHWDSVPDLDATQQDYLQQAHEAVAKRQGEQALEYLRLVVDAHP